MRHVFLAAMLAATVAMPMAGFAQTADRSGCSTNKVVPTSGEDRTAQNLTGNGHAAQTAQNLTGNGPRQTAQNLAGNGQHQVAQNLTGNGTRQTAQNLTGNGNHQTAQNLTGNGQTVRLASGSDPCR